MTAGEMIGLLDLHPHPEGGWYQETVRRRSEHGRDAMTAILFLLEEGQRSHWHRVDADELWLWQAGSPVDLEIAGDAGVTSYRLGCDPAAGALPQHLVPAGDWQSAQAAEGWALVSCVVVPGFAFGGFKLAPEGWRPV